MSERFVLFKQYNDLLLEIQSVKDEIKKREDALAELNEQGLVKDKVYGGEGGIQGFVIEGFPQREWDRRYQALKRSKEKLHQKETDLIEKVTEIDDYINSIKISRDRIVLKRYFVDGLKQHEIAQELFVERSTIAKIIAKYM